MNGSEREMDLFAEAVQLPPERRAALLQKACAGDAGLRASVEALLEAHMESGEFLEQPHGEIKVQKPRPGEKVGDHVGSYKLLQQIGEGGCGVVFMAEQEEPVRRKVAIKIVKPGMDTKAVIARFEAERQALALMDHPNIAHVLDAGTTESGRPYFAMELVRGVKITDYCDQNALKTSARLAMLLEVCDAVQHAHQKGIIHRDLKPSNILVTTMPSGKPLAKVIDFGIAKATTGHRLTDKTLFTAFELLIGTPAYMSPEQAALSSVDIDTRSDIYSLGVLLYELLTGSTPFDTSELLKRGLDEVRRVVCNVEPPRPSTRLSTLMAADLTTVSRHRHVEPPRLIREIRGDLDWIVMKALEKDRARRYATVNGFAIDIKRYLAGEAIAARPPSTVYKVQRFVSRNKLLCTGLCIVMALLLTCLIVTSKLLVQERRKRNEMAVTVAQMEADNLRGERYWDKAAGKYLEAIRLQAKDSDIAPIRERQLLRAAVECLTQAGKAEEANKLVSQYYAPAAASVAEHAPEWLYWRGAAMARQKRWDKAKDDLTLLLKYNSGSQVYHGLAAVMVAQRDVTAYQRLCRDMVARFRGTHNAINADKVVKDSCMLPNSGADVDAVASLAETAVTEGRGFPSYTFFLCSKALADYRQGRYQLALVGALEVLRDPFPYTQAEGRAVLAMVQFQQGSPEEARTTLASLKKVVQEKLPPPQSHDLGPDWIDWIIAHALLDEATSLIEGEATTNLDWR
jgi:serine/threonine protein kinase/tetratricopeptide (TPR) repeat protein